MMENLLETKETFPQKTKEELEERYIYLFLIRGVVNFKKIIHPDTAFF